MRRIIVLIALMLAICACASAETVIDGVTEIGDYAYERSDITGVAIKGSVKSIGEGAFYYCRQLESVSLPEGLEYIGDFAFDHCLQLKEVAIPSSVRRIGESAFCYNQSLETLTIAEGVEEIGAYAFSCCASVKRLILPSTVRSVSEGAFMGMRSLEVLYVPASAVFSGKIMFEDCPKLKVYYTPGTNIESYIRIFNLPYEAVDSPPVEQAKTTTIKFDGASVNALSVDCSPYLATRYFPVIDEVKSAVGTGALSKTALETLKTVSAELFASSADKTQSLSGTVSALWGEYYINKNGDRASKSFDGIHEGIDVYANSGANVRSLTDGTVKLRYGTSYGTIVIEKDGYFITYMHCANSYVNEGDYIAKGTVIGSQGRKGASGEHVHIEISNSYTGRSYSNGNDTLDSYSKMGNKDFYTVLANLMKSEPSLEVNPKRRTAIQTAYSWLSETWVLPCDLRLHGGSVVQKGATVRGLPYTLCVYGYNPSGDSDRNKGMVVTSYAQYKEYSDSFKNTAYIGAAGTTAMDSQGAATGKYTPKHGADCIQLVYTAWEEADSATPYRDYWGSSAEIDKNIQWKDALPGDAVFTKGDRYDHIRLITAIDKNGTPDDATDDSFTCVEQTASSLGGTLKYKDASYTMIGTRENVFTYSELINGGYCVWRNTCLDS